MTKMRLALLLAAMVSSVVEAAPADDIRSLMEAGKFSDAYRLGNENTDELGNPGFDFFYGIAALDGGNPGEGVLALERFLLTYPKNRSAHFHLARGYYILGEDQRARTEFSTLLNGASEAELVGIQGFLDAIRARESRYLPTATFFTEVGIGHDSNINAGANTGSVAGLPGFTVSSASTSSRESDSFMTLLAGAQGSRPLAPGLMAYAGLQGNGRWHSSSQNDIFNQYGGLIQGGLTAIDGRNLYRIGADYNQLAIDGQNYLHTASILGEWGRQVDQFNRLGLQLQYSQLRYEDVSIYLDKQKTISSPSGARQRDGNLVLLTGSWAHAFAHPWNPVATLFISAGKELNQRDRDEFSRDIYGARATLTLQPADKWSISTALAYQNSRYQDNFSSVSLYPKRQDNYSSLEIATAYTIDRNWSVRAEGTWVDQRSNIGLYDYGRNIFALKLRYDYK